MKPRICTLQIRYRISESSFIQNSKEDHDTNSALKYKDKLINFNDVHDLSTSDVLFRKINNLSRAGESFPERSLRMQ